MGYMALKHELAIIFNQYRLPKRGTHSRIQYVSAHSTISIG